MTDLAWTRPLLAELCGATLESGVYCPWPGDAPYSYETWRPDEDVAQAIRCADALEENYGRLWGVQKTLTSPGYGAWTRDVGENAAEVIPGKTPARAIVLAIAAALGWKEGET